MEEIAPYIYNLGLLFYSVSEKYPDKVAILDENGRAISFRQLNEKSNRIARFLARKNVCKGNVVCIFNNKSFDGFALMLACIKSGIIYVNLDHTSPEERLRKIIAACRPALIFDFFGNAAVDGTEIINSSKGFENYFSGESAENMDVRNIPGSCPAYIMFTSGSTGFPKGATMTHANVLNFISWGRTEYEIRPDDRMTNVNPIYFDNSVFDFYVSVFNGASLLPLTAETVKDPRMLVSKINEHKPTVWFSVPSMLIFLLTTKSLTPNDFRSLRVITFGGEGFPKAKLKQLFDLYKSHVRFVNVYGPTECTCICSAYDITEKDFDDMVGIPPLGSLSPNFDYVIVDEDNRRTNSGELCLIGPQVGLGYYNDHDRTSKSFVQNPLNSYSHEIMYRTGDIVSLKDDGKLYFVARKDNQIKHMGYRIELEEIESAINTISNVRETCVVYKKEPSGIGQILAYVVSDKEEGEILKYLRKLLPSYMIPRQVIRMDVLPKNKNGKIDRAGLSARQLSQ